MNKVRQISEIKARVRTKISPILPPEERFKALANLIIDRLIEEQANGNLEKLLPSKKL